MAVLSQPVAGFSAELPADLSNKQVQKRMSPAARKAFFKIAAAWKIRDEEAKQLLGGISNGVFYEMKAGETKTPLDQGNYVPIGHWIVVGTGNISTARLRDSLVTDLLDVVRLRSIPYPGSLLTTGQFHELPTTRSCELGSGLPMIQTQPVPGPQKTHSTTTIRPGRTGCSTSS